MKTPQFISDISQKLQDSFSLAWKGEEKMFNVLLWWGTLSYIICYFTLRIIVESVEIRFIEIITALIIVTYYIWHIIVIKRCSPKKPKLSKEEEKKLKAQRRKELPKNILRKIFLKEPVSKWNPPLMFTVIDAYIVIIYTMHIFYADV
ncbi:MAG: hypothetical protein O3B09_00405 [Proteobacteria bacterium]|nr:hypothetical protein [Pseudomonadota bacterium]